MASGKQIAGLMIALTIAITLFGPINAAVVDNTGEQTVTNESVTADLDNYVGLDSYSIKDGSETVLYDNGTDWVEATSGTDYEMAYDNGSIKALSTGSISDGQELKVSYDYEATSGTTTTVTNLVPLFVALLVLGVMGARATEML